MSTPVEVAVLVGAGVAVDVVVPVEVGADVAVDVNVDVDVPSAVGASVGVDVLDELLGVGEPLVFARAPTAKPATRTSAPIPAAILVVNLMSILLSFGLHPP